MPKEKTTDSILFLLLVITEKEEENLIEEEHGSIRSKPIHALSHLRFSCTTNWKDCWVYIQKNTVDYTNLYPSLWIHSFYREQLWKMKREQADECSKMFIE